MITWKAIITVCMCCSRMDATLTGLSYWTYGKSFPVLVSEYVDDKAIIFQHCVNVSDGVSSIILYFARFDTEIHKGLIHHRGESKIEILFCSKSLFIYDNPET